jgi:hypothetical protein
MDLLKIYYYTSVPILTCNLLFYSISTLSTSIISSQNIVRFISEHKVCDSIVFKNEIETLDIQNKLKIVESLIFDVIKRYCKTNEEFEQIKTNIKTPIICDEEAVKGFTIIDIKNNITILDRIDEPVRYALLSTSETIQFVNEIIIKIHEKILRHDKSYLNKFVALYLQVEIQELKKQITLLDRRLQLLFEILKIYLPISN